MEPEYIAIAKQMLDRAFLPRDLEKALRRAARLAEAAGGYLISRQTIAAIIALWEQCPGLPEED